MPQNSDYTDHFLALINLGFRDWQGFSDPRFVEGETEYKREAAEKAVGALK